MEFQKNKRSTVNRYYMVLAAQKKIGIGINAYASKAKS